MYTKAKHCEIEQYKGQRKDTKISRKEEKSPHKKNRN